MTLDQWKTKHRLYVGALHESLARYVAGLSPNDPAHPELWNLVDYRVTSVGGGCVWLMPKK